MALDFQALQTEFFARGFAYLNDAGAGLTRVKRWLNDSAHEIDDMELWDYRRASTTGTSPLTISDLGVIDAVMDGANFNELAPTTLGDLESLFGEVASTGTATFFYLNAGAITTYPVTSGTLTVKYYRVAPDMSNNSDTPLMPDRFRMAIVERALSKAYLSQDDPEMAAVCIAESDRIVDRMREVYTLQVGGQRQVVYGFSGDW